ncbi:MAG: DUF1995 family protein [Cyanobacteria bacterium P01_A01_bin.84]
MTQLPKTLEEAVIQSQQATQAAIDDGYRRLQVELLFPELKIMPVAQQFLPVFAEYKDKLKVFFADAGSGALAKRDWAEIPFQIQDIGTGRSVAAEEKIQSEDEVFAFISPTSVEVPELEKLCNEIGDRPFVMLNPRLEDSGVVGIGYAARKTRERFINTIDSCYYLRPIYDEAALFRCYPGIWEVWVKKGEDYEKVADLPKKPSGEEIDLIIYGGQTTGEGETAPSGNKPGVFKGLQRFIKALTS